MTVTWSCTMVARSKLSATADKRPSRSIPTEAFECGGVLSPCRDVLGPEGHPDAALTLLLPRPGRGHRERSHRRAGDLGQQSPVVLRLDISAVGAATAGHLRGQG